MTEPVWDFPMRLPRHAFSARDAARAGDVWRCFQEAAIEASTLAGWSPQRYRREGSAFIVRSMTVVHHREAEYGEKTTAFTWVSRFRREIFTTREIRLAGENGPVASATQEWAHVSAALEPMRAPRSLVEAFPVHDGGPSIELPTFDATPDVALAARTLRFETDVWWTWMDPLDHVNHPAYVDFCDEAISRRMIEVGLSPTYLLPLAERVTFRAAVDAGQRAIVETRPRGVTRDGAVVLAHRVLVAPDRIAAEATTIRSLAGGDPALLVRAFTEA